MYYMAETRTPGLLRLRELYICIREKKRKDVCTCVAVKLIIAVLLYLMRPSFFCERRCSD